MGFGGGRGREREGDIGGQRGKEIQVSVDRKKKRTEIWVYVEIINKDMNKQ